MSTDNKSHMSTNMLKITNDAYNFSVNSKTRFQSSDISYQLGLIIKKVGNNEFSKEVLNEFYNDF
jgi:hypothetical protein